VPEGLKVLGPNMEPASDLPPSKTLGVCIAQD